MTSFFARNNNRLSQQTYDAWMLYGEHPPNSEQRLHFYRTYLQDIVPFGVAIHHVPAIPAHQPAYRNTREEIQLILPSRDIFMSGVLSMEVQTNYLHSIAADEAYTNWLEGYCVPDDGNWRFFTLTGVLSFFKGYRHDGWAIDDYFEPMDSAQDLAAYLQREYDSLRYR